MAIKHLRKDQREQKQLNETMKFFKKSDKMAGGLTIKATGISGLKVPSEIQYEKDPLSKLLRK